MIKDYFGKDASSLNNKSLWLLDMDGTIYQENRLFDGTLDFLDKIKRNNGKYVFITNNSSKSVKDYIDKIKSMGIDAEYDDFFTSSQATALFLNDKYKNKKIYCQGTKSLVDELKSFGVNVTVELEDDIDVVLVGFDNEMTSQKLRNTCELLTLRDLPFYATNMDLVCPVSFGYVPDCGSICEMIYNATKKRPIFIGKPKPTMIEYCIKKYNKNASDTVVVGDRLYTDILSAVNANVDSICVLSGEATLEDINSSEFKPTYLFNSIKDLL